MRRGEIKFSGSVTWLCCPICAKLGILDDDELHGRVSTQCPRDGCDYHETANWNEKMTVALMERLE